jgi:acetaldehyde dehydrogenase
MRAAIVGAGNVGADLLEKLRRSTEVDLTLVTDVDASAPGVVRAADHGIPVSRLGAEAVLGAATDIDVVFDASTAAVHRRASPGWLEAGLRVVDLTPASSECTIVPSVNLASLDAQPEISLASCSAQAAVPIVAAIGTVASVDYAEVVSTLASRSVGPGMSGNIDEFTQATAFALEAVAGAGAGKAIIIVSPAEPPVVMRNTVMCLVAGESEQLAISAALDAAVVRMQAQVPGYRMSAAPVVEPMDDGRLKVTVLLQVSGASDVLPDYAGNVDLVTTAAVLVSERLAAAKEASAP